MIEVTAKMDTEMIPVVPSQVKYVYVGGVWSHLGAPINSTDVLTLFSVSFTREG